MSFSTTISVNEILEKILKILPRIANILKDKTWWPAAKKEILFLLPKELRKPTRSIFSKRNKNIYEQHNFNEFEKEILKKYKEITNIDLNYIVLEKKPLNVEKLTDDEIVEIKKQIWKNKNRKEIAKKYGIGLLDVHQIEIGGIFSHIPDPKFEKVILDNKVQIRKKKRGKPTKNMISARLRAEEKKEELKDKELKGRNNKISPKDVRKIKQRLLKGEKISVLAKEFGLGYKQVHHIKSGRRWGHIKP